MDQLANRLATLTTPDAVAKVAAEPQDSLGRDMNTQLQSISGLLPDTNEGRSTLRPNTFDVANPALRTEALKSFTDNIPNPRYPPLETLPCANVQAAKYEACSNPGTMACSQCKLVLYCSKECQKGHWRLHKQDCKNSIRSEDWIPAWSREGRPPSFITHMTFDEQLRQKKPEEFSLGLYLWGNTPATDVINLPCNEKNEKDFFLAFIASGDLRHILRTVNGLPSTYSGSLKILLNDINVSIVCRNIVLLLILGTTPDEAIAADMALHFWYSVFMPMEYRLRMSVILTQSLQQTKEGKVVIPLGPNSTLYCCIPEEATYFFSHLISPSISIGNAQEEYDRVRTAPLRGDFRDRMYAMLRPSHRVAFQEYRRFGIVLPFGAIKSHFNCPNPSLFSPQGKWLQTDSADPLEGWDVDAIVKTGKAHGAQPEDIYGCLYFFLSEQLRMCAQRFQKFKVSFSLFACDARRLPKAIHEGLISEFGVPPSIRFDRIEVSNILDANYVGIDGVLSPWSLLLAEGKSAAIIGYFMNWFALEEDGRATGTGVNPAVFRGLWQRVADKTMVNGWMPKSISLENEKYFLADDMEALYENWGPFSRFLKKQGLDKILQKTKLRLREKHTVVPHRILAPLGGPPSALPVFPDDASWYYQTKLACFSWSERFVEFAHA